MTQRDREDFCMHAAPCGRMGFGPRSLRPAWRRCGQAVAAGYPERPVTIVSAFPAGGIVDVIARRLAQNFSERFKQSFVVENRTGAAGSIGYSAVARAASRRVHAGAWPAAPRPWRRPARRRSPGSHKPRSAPSA